MTPSSLFKWFKDGLNKWRLTFLIFILIYVAFLLLNISFMSPQWDEVVNLNGGLFLVQGNFYQFQAWNNFYPPMYAVFIAGFFSVGGVSVFMGRLVSIVFSLLSVYAVFEFTYRIYNAKTALLASVLFAVMPGYIWLSRVAMIETTLIFFFTVATLSFFLWLREHKNKFLVISIIAFIFGALTKYQTAIVAVIAVVALAFLGRDYLLKKFRSIPRLVIAVIAVGLLLTLLFYWFYVAGMLNLWLYAMNIGNPDKTIYSTGLDRFPAWFNPLPGWIQIPIFYLLEIGQPYPLIHPISLIIYAIGLAGLGWLAIRRKPADKYLVIWFIVVYVFFTIIPNRQWRYLVPVFAVLAVSGANLIVSALDKAQRTWKLPQLSVEKKRLVQIGAISLIVLTIVGVAFSVNDAHTWVAQDQIHIPIEETAQYLTSHLENNQSAVIVCATNVLEQAMFRFYMPPNMSASQVWQYPEQPVDTYTPDFNITQFIRLCEQRDVKYIILFDYGIHRQFFNTTLDYAQVLTMLNDTSRFGVTSDQPFFGDFANNKGWRIFLVRFNQTVT